MSVVISVKYNSNNLIIKKSFVVNSGVLTCQTQHNEQCNMTNKLAKKSRAKSKI